MEYIDIDLYGTKTAVLSKSKGGRADVLPSVMELVAHLRATRTYSQEWGEDTWLHDHSGQLFLESGVRLRTLFELTGRLFITASQEKLWDRVFDSAVSHIQYGSYK